MKRILSLFAAAALVATLPSAGHADVLRCIGHYCADRGNDLMDVLRIRGGAPDGGKGGGIKARVTSLAQVGYVYFDGTYAGMDRRGIGVVDERRREGGVSLLYGSYNNMEPRTGNFFLKTDTPWSLLEDRRLLRNLPYWDDGRKRFLSVGAEVAAPLAAVDLGVYPEEALDFVLGFTTIDIFNDDKLYGIHVPHHDATTPPGPKKDAPFAEKQAKFDAFKAQMAAKALQDAGEGGESTEKAADGTMVPQGDLPAQMPTPEAAPGLIDAKFADEALMNAEKVQEDKPAPAPVPSAASNPPPNGVR